MRQLLGALVLVVATYFGVLRVAETKCEEAIGSTGYALDALHADDLAAFGRLQATLNRIGQGAFAARLEQLRAKNELWVAPDLGAGRWAVYVEALGLVKRVYVRRLALRDPQGHLFEKGFPEVPDTYRDPFAWLGLGGAMRHELAHRDGSIDEAAAYRIELGWYEEVSHSAFVQKLDAESRPAWDWAIDSAILTVRKAASSAGALL